tara:strand:+ start:53 stop:418 length:366 start_codon:yes stop_codon:yes gene_type:complete
MKLFKIPKVTGDVLVADNFIYVDVTTLADVTVNAATTVLGGTGWTLTFTFDGSTAEKLANANAMAAYLVPKMLDFNGPDVNRKNQAKTFDLWSGLTIAQILAEVGLASPGTNDGFVSVALS